MIRPSAARGSGSPCQRAAQPADLDAALVDRVVQRAVPPAVLRGQRQADQVTNRAVRAQHRVGELEQGIRPPGQTVVELLAEPTQHFQVLDGGDITGQAVLHGLMPDHGVFGEKPGSTEGRFTSRRHAHPPHNTSRYHTA
ncbi:hypothetical protein Francci3_2063 [Frankia casuarinae]|jgi:hypothetical protein|uniref:Uncharacterized protein n=1 Tax=Frankia casuarinae (strain DSM 45818 / CECT 9043 / HFP020203 / CcI3) TaxID=106370 RepID=Q2JBA6_FRACC|nr:hypothetical protein Francci3_2063 [Frankia casuarinae]